MIGKKIKINSDVSKAIQSPRSSAPESSGVFVRNAVLGIETRPAESE